MAEGIDKFLQKIITDFKASNTCINGVLITDKSGLILGSHEINNESNGSIALLSDLASTLFEKPAIVCLENGDQKLIVREAGKTVFGIYADTLRR